MMSEKKTIAESEAFVRALYRSRIPEWRLFHSIGHTEGVVSACRQMLLHYDLSGEDSFALVTAAWFHDVGYCNGTVDHEMESCMIARAFLSSAGTAIVRVGRIESLILATVKTHSPANALEGIIRDADMHHLGSSEYPQWAAMLKKEVEKDLDQPITEEKWNADNIRFLSDHRFYTSYAKAKWDEQKTINLQKLINNSGHAAQ